MIADLRDAGLTEIAKIYRNLSPVTLVEHSVARGEGTLASDGPLTVQTGNYTGRSPNDKFTVKDAITHDTVWWGKENKSMTPEGFAHLHQRISAYLQGKEVYVQDVWAGHDPDYRMPVRIITQRPHHSMFAHNMFVQARAQELETWQPSFTVLQAPGFKAVPEIDGTNSEAGIVIDFSRRMVLICGTEYAGEIKKSIFTVLNFELPTRGVLGMHCSANVGDEGDSALFFGLSGTGKTTLSADPDRGLVGDDEHGWSDNGIFNFEGGCYAKVIRLDPKAEPEIFATTKRFGTLLENVVMDPDDRSLDLDDDRYTQNTRASYDISQIPNVVTSGRAGHPKNIIMLTCDAFGVLPPLSRMSPEQAMYHFISGYTAKVAGTERGVTEPMAVFSACFGSPFMARHPAIYAELLGKKIAAYGASCWLVNTGWTGGPYGTGTRISIHHTRALLNAALSGSLDQARFTPHPLFKISVPHTVPGVPSELLNPHETWNSQDDYQQTAAQLVGLFAENFAQFSDVTSEAIRSAGPAMP